MKIFVYDENWESVRGSFELANALYFGGRLEISPFEGISELLPRIGQESNCLVFVDILAVPAPSMGGYRILRQLLSQGLVDRGRVVLMAGYDDIRGNLKRMGISLSTAKVILKPFAFDQLAKSILSWENQK